MAEIKLTALTALGLLGGCIVDLFGGWDAGLQSLFLFMAIDYITGLIVAGVFKKSRKSLKGALESRAAWKGLLRKGASLGVVLIACRLDLLLGSTIIRDATVIAYCGNELMSITENIGLMGVPLPKVITNALEALQQKDEH
ncbi:phage holin family protein [Acetobacterium wieringae]|uniref:Phage holin family protein n=1 Tax=Acetobacterium wieringae TaxID=52694 RepID=A0A5D0WNK8_9FIRM|nr:phage holin family protein [Acetobacterium wieringae]TYC85623.1 phage holin family protein [Acetobacterium wieringae]